MYLNYGAVEAKVLNSQGSDLLGMQILKHLNQCSILGPSVHAFINAIPFPAASRKGAPFTAVFKYEQHCIQHLRVGVRDIAPLNRKQTFNLSVLSL